jgi:hypothetical protein
MIRLGFIGIIKNHELGNPFLTSQCKGTKEGCFIAQLKVTCDLKLVTFSCSMLQGEAPNSTTKLT